MQANDITLYAIWTIKSNISITFDGNSATGGSVPTALTNQTYNTTVTLPGNTGALVRAGYTFAGWSIVAPPMVPPLYNSYGIPG